MLTKGRVLHRHIGITGQKRTVTKASLRYGPFGLGKLQNTPAERAKRKAELLVALEPLDRGLNCTDAEAAMVEKLTQDLETLNPTPQPLASEQLNGKWRLVYTTSQSILGASKPKVFRPAGPIYQYLDNESLKARNEETTPLYNMVDAELTPDGDSKVNVQFKLFKIFGRIPVNAPPSAKGYLDVTFLDSDMRICRGDKGNLFILLMEDPSARL